MGKKLNSLRLIVLIPLLISSHLWAKVENGIKLPPKPDQAKIKAGEEIDVNRNGVRDDIENYIYESVTKDKAKYDLYLKYVEEEESFLKSEGNNEKAMGHQINLFALQDCLSKMENKPLVVGKYLSSVKLLIINNKKKIAIHERIVNKIGYPLSEDVKKKGMKCNI